jgi:hypothetical protein
MQQNTQLDMLRGPSAATPGGVSPRAAQAPASGSFQ